MGGIRNKENKRPVIRYMLYLLLIVSVIAGVALSRYVSTLSGTDSARAAQFDYAVSVERNEADALTAPFDGYADYWAFDNDSQSADGLNTRTANGSKKVEFDISLYATTKLSDPKVDEGNFDNTARVIDVTITNNSEVAVNTVIKSLGTIPSVDTEGGNGIVWCLFEGTYTGYSDIIAKLGYAPTGDDYETLIAALNAVNKDTLAAWNADAVLDPGGSEKTLTLVFWAEHAAVKASGWDFGVADDSGLLMPTPSQSIAIQYGVTQVD